MTEVIEPEFYDPPTNLAEMDRLREIAPILRVRFPVGGTGWLVTEHGLARQMLTDSRLGRAPLTDGQMPYRATFPRFLTKTLLFTDDPEHARLRRIVAKWFTARRVEALRARTAETAHRLIDEMVAAGAPANLIEFVCDPLPIDVLCNVLGLDPAMKPTFQAWSRTLQATGSVTDEELDTAQDEMGDFLMRTIVAKRVDPGEDLLSSLASAVDKDESLTDEEILPIAMLILAAGFDNTANTIGAGVYALLGHPEQRQRLLDDPALIKTAVEEILRHGRVSMGNGLRNTGVPFIALEAIDVAGVRIEAGEFVVVHRTAANHDGAVFAEPERFDVGREVNPHLGLSHGIHHCLGAPLARMELQVAVGAIFERLPGLELAGPPNYLATTISQPMIDLPVRW